MPGKQCKGDAEVAKCRESDAFCEGLSAATNGEAQNTNPHPANSDDALAWDKGWGAYELGVGTPSTVCCADPVYDGVP